MGGVGFRRSLVGLVVAAAGVLPAAMPAAAADPCVTSAGTMTCTFDYTGAVQTLTVPTGVSQATIQAYGAQGGDTIGFSPGGAGGSASAIVPVVAGSTMTVVVGGVGQSFAFSRAPGPGGTGGFGGGGAGASGDFPGAGGGGASRVTNEISKDPLVIAAGGGGAANAGGPGGRGTGGSGGGLVGGTGVNALLGPGLGGAGGTQTAGGAGAGSGSGAGTAGTAGQGGDGGNAGSCFGSVVGGGGGGGGLFGGGGGNACSGGGGGSSYVNPIAVSSSNTTSNHSGNGQVIITFTLPPVTISARATTPSSVLTGTTYPADRWTNEDVTVTFTCTNAAPNGCPAAQTFSQEGTFTATGTATGVGGDTATTTFGPIKIDRTRPTGVASAVNADGTPYTLGSWTRSSSVTVNTTCSDLGGSGVAFCPTTAVVTAEGESDPFFGNASTTDNAGNAGFIIASPVRIDRTPPTVTVTATNADTSTYTPGTKTGQPVTVSYTCSDPLPDNTPALRFSSGVAPGSCPADEVVSAVGTNSVSHTVLDNAGNSTPVSLSVIIVPPPTVSCGTADGLWHAGDVSIPCTASDLNVGLKNPADASFNLTTSVPAGTETSDAATNSRTVANNGGGTTTAGPITGNKVDKKAPSIVITTPASAFYLLGQTVTASYGCTDGGSGLNTCTGPVANGAAINTGTVGSKVFTVNATDQVGNASSASVTYSVGYRFAGFFSPVGNPPTVNGGTPGQTYPLKWRLSDANGTAVTAPTTYRSLSYQKTACPGTTGASGAVTRITSPLAVTDGQFQVNWKTPNVAGCYTVTLTLDSGQQFQALYNLRK